MVLSSWGICGLTFVVDMDAFLPGVNFQNSGHEPSTLSYIEDTAIPPHTIHLIEALIMDQHCISHRARVTNGTGVTDRSP